MHNISLAKNMNAVAFSEDCFAVIYLLGLFLWVMLSFHFGQDFHHVCFFFVLG